MYIEEPKYYSERKSRKSANIHQTNNIDELARLLGVAKNKLAEAINNPEYFEYTIPKKKGGSRNIQAPGNLLKQIQRKLNQLLQNEYRLQGIPNVHGFIINNELPAKNILTNAQEHINKKVVLNIDLLNFFESIPARKVFEVITHPPFNIQPDIAKAITLLATYKNQLPTGAPTSPVISNMICLNMDMQLVAIANKSGWKYTRYADDLTFSSHQPMAVKDIFEVIDIIRKNGFEINAKKFRIQSDKSKQSVTGIKVNQKPNLERSYIKNIRAALFQWEKQGMEKAAFSEPELIRKFGHRGTVNLEEAIWYFLNRLKGRIEYVGMVRGKSDKIYNDLYARYEGLLYEFMMS